MKQAYILAIVLCCGFFGLYFYNQKMEAKRNYYMAVQPECIPPKEYKKQFYSDPISKQLAIVKGCAISISPPYRVKVLIDGEP